MKIKTNMQVAACGWLAGGLILASPVPAAHAAPAAFAHPGVLLSRADLDAVKADLDKEPWKSAYDKLKNDARSQKTYAMQGPWATVSRNPNVRLGEWQSDMQAVYNLARMWYFTGDNDYAQRAHDVLLAWATTQTAFGGAEAAFAIGDSRCATAADILRATWPGWTAGDTGAVQNYFNTVFWPVLAVPGPLFTGSQGMEQLTGALGVAIFNEDATKFDQVLAAFQTDANTGLRGTLPNGEVVDTGRDQGHTSLYVRLAAEMGQAFWNQGVDVFSLLDNRILAVGEYYARYHLPDSAPSYVPFGGMSWGVFNAIAGAPRSTTQARTALNLLHTAYAVRKGVDTHWVDLYATDQVEDTDSFMFRRRGDTSAATPPAPPSPPPVATLTGGLTSADLHGAAPAGATAYAAGAWTLTGGYNGQAPAGSKPTIRFAHRPVTGDFTMIAKVNAVSSAGSNDAQAGIMIRDVATGQSVSQSYIAMTTDHRYGWNERGATAMAYSWMAGAVNPAPQLPYWIKMERIGKRVQTSTSPDGASWSGANSNDFANMPATAYVGLFASSAVTGQASTATFSDVAITGGDGGGVTNAPPTPLSVVATPADGRVIVRWTEAHGATGYQVLRSTAGGGPYTEVAAVGNTTWTDTAAANGTRYHYVVTASNTAGTSGQSPEDSALPAPSWVNVAFGGTATASSTGDGAASLAFDGNPGSRWHAATTAVPQWLRYDFGAGVAQTIRRYGVTSSVDSPSRDPSAWQLQASQDGSDWVVLDSQSAQAFAFKYQTRYYDVANDTAYRHYRLYISGGANVQVAELGLYANTGGAN
ncbi:discoidin domain-containing protein [Pseudoduganella namucuonensis]|uniref:Regulation of enolase protein 1, concanavalin A-like superfamily n=1 Tax=Pseudoduganella namucuonensis TaxID=1035707 RepID=A0A1I7LWB1_9BURK|nr:discoidin domain-containing protein [Pseudoduganella namucuonensis]SFV13958.1 Regulation of enolase protein 1, concanavalin A-like superfamily [Pseudoduganella namucuonensis]